MAEPCLAANTIFIDVGKGPEPYTISGFVPNTIVDVPNDEQEVITENAQSSTVKVEQNEDNPSIIIQTRRFKCPSCPRYSAENEEKLQRHIKRKHLGENPFSCYMCDYSTYNKTLFEEHVRIHQGIKPFKCVHCDHASVSKKNLKKHELIHRPNNPLRCKLCSFIAQNLVCLKHHQRKGCEQEFMCDICDFVGKKNSKEVEEHLSKHKSYKCKKCSYRTKLENKFSKHEKSCKGIKDSKFQCKVCQWTSKHDAKILLHLIHHPNQKVDENIIDISVLRKHKIMT